MDVNKLAGACLILFGVINVLREIMLRLTERSRPGFAYAFVTALLFTFGTVLFLRRNSSHDLKPSKAKGPSILED